MAICAKILLLTSLPHFGDVWASILQNKYFTSQYRCLFVLLFTPNNSNNNKEKT